MKPESKTRTMKTLRDKTRTKQAKQHTLARRAQRNRKNLATGRVTR